METCTPSSHTGLARAWLFPFIDQQKRQYLGYWALAVQGARVPQRSIKGPAARCNPRMRSATRHSAHAASGVMGGIGSPRAWVGLAVVTFKSPHDDREWESATVLA